MYESACACACGSCRCLLAPTIRTVASGIRLRRVGIVCLHALRFACERIEGSGLGGGDGGGERGGRLGSTCAKGNRAEHEPSPRKIFNGGNFCNGVPTISWTFVVFFFKCHVVNR